MCETPLLDVTEQHSLRNRNMLETAVVLSQKSAGIRSAERVVEALVQSPAALVKLEAVVSELLMSNMAVDDVVAAIEGTSSSSSSAPSKKPQQEVEDDEGNDGSEQPEGASQASNSRCLLSPSSALKPACFPRL